MVERVFSGRRRHPVKIVLYAIFTFGVYGRVFVYKTLKELDGHEALFLDLKVYRILLILPIIGPLVAKWKLAKLLPTVLRHDEAASRVHVGGLRWAALIPWFPVFHVFVQLHLNPHWELHRKMDDLAAKREVLVELLKSRRAADQEQAKQLELDIKRREEDLENAREAALALRAAEEARRRAEEEIRKAGGRKKPMKRLVGAFSSWRPRRAEAAAGEAEPPQEPEEGVEKKSHRGRFGLRRSPEPEATTAEPTEEPSPEAPRAGLLGRVFKRGEKPVPPEGEPGPSAAGDPAASEGLSRKERKALRRQEKEKRKQEKAAEKQRGKDEKARLKAEQREAKLRAKAEKARQKEEEKGAAAAPPSDASPAGSPPQKAAPETPASPPAESEGEGAKARGKKRKGGPPASKAKARAR